MMTAGADRHEERIESVANSAVKLAKTLHRRKGRDASGLILLEGRRLAATGVDTETHHHRKRSVCFKYLRETRVETGLSRPSSGLDDDFRAWGPGGDVVSLVGRSSKGSSLLVFRTNIDATRVCVCARARACARVRVVNLWREVAAESV